MTVRSVELVVVFRSCVGLTEGQLQHTRSIPRRDQLTAPSGIYSIRTISSAISPSITLSSSITIPEHDGNASLAHYMYM
jgi:hypothetical protein